MKVTVVTQAYCESCTKVKDHLSDLGIEFTMCSVDHQGSTELRRLLESQEIRTVPAVFWEGTYIGGYEDTVEFFEHLIGQAEDQLEMWETDALPN